MMSRTGPETRSSILVLNNVELDPANLHSLEEQIGNIHIAKTLCFVQSNRSGNDLALDRLLEALGPHQHGILALPVDHQQALFAVRITALMMANLPAVSIVTARRGGAEGMGKFSLDRVYPEMSPK